MKKYDFSGYATKYDVKCADGRTIRKDAFKENDGLVIPLVWQHIHDDVKNVLGHAVLESRDDGMYSYCKFNNTPAGINAKQLVEHGDIVSLSIYANGLVQKGENVVHGVIRELSLVLAGANKGALIDNLAIEHSDGSYVSDENEAIIYSGEDILHAATTPDAKPKAGGKTVKEVFDTLNEEQKNVVYAMLAQAIEDDSLQQSEGETDDDYKGGYTMKKNVFDTNVTEGSKRESLSHSQIVEILKGAEDCGSLKESFLSHTQEYGIENIDFLFPDAKNMTQTPDMIMRENGWVAGVISETYHTPFARIKSTCADITADEARAKGYVKGALKKEEVIKLLKRTTDPTTIYKKQKLDRDDIIDITDFDIVSWMRSEMRLMLDEEVARAVLIGDGREPDDADKINEERIRPIYKDVDMYAHHVLLASTVVGDSMVEAILRARANYKGSGSPKFYTTTAILTDMLLVKDTTGRRIYSTQAELAAALRVSSIVEVPVFENVSRILGTDVAPITANLIGIVVNLTDYTIGADKGGEISMFDDFDIDFNQYKYLIEGRCSGALKRPKSALVIEQNTAVAEG